MIIALLFREHNTSGPGFAGRAEGRAFDVFRHGQQTAVKIVSIAVALV